MSDDWLADLKEVLKQGVLEQMERHRRVDPEADERKVIDIQMRHVREKLELHAKKLEREGKDAAAETVRDLAEDWLPYLARELKRR
jgi:hypothetical protein